MRQCSRSMTRGGRPQKRSPTPQENDPTSPQSALSPVSPITPGGGRSPRRSPIPTPDENEKQQRHGPVPLYLNQPFVKAALVKGNFKLIVMQPKWVDINEWVAINSKRSLPPLYDRLLTGNALRCCALKSSTSTTT